MAQHEQNGSGAGPQPHERAESAWRRTDDSAESGESVTAGTPDPSAPAPVSEPAPAPSPSPREQWFGGFEGAPPPPPPYAQIPEEAPPPPQGTPFRAPAPEESAERTGEDGTAFEEPSDDPADDAGGPEEMRSSTVRLVPGNRNRPRPSGPWQEERRPQRPQRLGQDPLGPRKLRGDSDVPEPEQLPPLEAERTESPDPDAPTRSGPAPLAPWSPGGSGTASSPSAGAGATEAESPSAGAKGAQSPGGPVPGVGNTVQRTEPAPERPDPPRSLTGPRDPGSAPPPRGADPDPGRSAASGAAVRNEADQGETSDSLNAATLVRNRRQGPSTGWRKAVHTASLGLINPGESARVLRQRELIARACTPVASGHHRVAVLSLKGGVGKTTTTVALGATLASLRGDRVLAVDANPDRGTLSDKVRLETAATIRDLLNERHLVSRYADIRGFTSQAPSRLEILASDRDPAVSEAFSDADYREVARIVEHFYSICLTDCGTGLLHDAMRGVLGLANQVVLVSSASVDGARSASATLDWLEAHGHLDLVRGAVVVLSMVRSNAKSSVDLNRLQEHFAGRCRSVVRVPWDGHLEEGAEVDLDQLAPATRDAYLQLAASVGEAFARQP